MSEKETPKEVRRVTRVALRPASEAIIDGWRATLREAFPSFSPSLSDLIAWAVERTPALSKKDIQEIRQLLFDEVKELEVQLELIKEAKNRGDIDALRALLIKIKGRKCSFTKKKKQSAVISEDQSLASDSEQLNSQPFSQAVPAKRNT
jgi:hypothetical protein